MEVSPTTLGGALGACENFESVYDFGDNFPERFLTQTAQIQMEICLMINPRIASIIKSFRREADVHDGRHLREFHLVEIEKANSNLEEMLEVIERLVRRILASIQELVGSEIANSLNFDFEQKIIIFDRPFERLSYTEAIEILSKSGFDVQWGDDLKHNHEVFLSDYAQHNPLFLTHFPKEIKFFNMKENSSNPEIVNSVDLILPFSGESLGGAERETNADNIWKRFESSEAYSSMKKKGITKDDLGCYFSVIENMGIHPTFKDIQSHLGFGLGLERLLQSVFSTKQTDIRLFSLPYILNSWTVDRQKL